LGHAAFWGIGAYTIALLQVHGITNNFWLIITTVILASAAFGCVFGFLSLRTKGLFFVLIHLAFAEILRALTRKLRVITGGEDGLGGFGAPFDLDGLHLYYFVFLFFVICSFLLYWLVNSRFGDLLEGIRENEPRMQALGYNTWAIKFICFIIAGIFGALSGSLFSFWNLLVSPDDFSLWITGKAILMVLIGGFSYFIGPIVGAIVIVLLSQVVSTYTMHWTGIAGVAMIIVVMFARQGIVGIGEQLWRQGIQIYGKKSSFKA
jgi:branched-chain amino acid transport system permease protein